MVQFYGSILETSLEGGPIRTKIITDWCEEGPVIEYVRRNPDVDRHRLGSSNLSRETIQSSYLLLRWSISAKD